MDLCYDVLTMDVVKFENRYKPLIWSEAAEYAFHYLKIYKEDYGYDGYQAFFEILKKHGEKRKLITIDDLKSKKNCSHVKDCLRRGKEGVIQLIDERLKKEFTEIDIHSFDHFIKIVERENMRFYQVFKDALKMNSYDFYKKYELDWNIAVSETIYFLASLKWTDSDKYEENLEIITSSMEFN